MFLINQHITGTLSIWLDYTFRTLSTFWDNGPLIQKVYRSYCNSIYYEKVFLPFTGHLASKLRNSIYGGSYHKENLHVVLRQCLSRTYNQLYVKYENVYRVWGSSAHSHHFSLYCKTWYTVAKICCQGQALPWQPNKRQKIANPCNF